MDYADVWDFQFFKLQLAQVTERPAHDNDDFSDSPWRSDLQSLRQHHYMQLHILPSAVINPPNPPFVDTKTPLEHQK